MIMVVTTILIVIVVLPSPELPKKFPCPFTHPQSNSHGNYWINQNPVGYPYEDSPNHYPETLHEIGEDMKSHGLMGRVMFIRGFYYPMLNIVSYSTQHGDRYHYPAYHFTRMMQAFPRFYGNPDSNAAKK